MEIKIRYTFKRKSDGHIYQNVTPIECVEGKGDQPTILSNYEDTWEVVGRDLYVMDDKHGQSLFTGDIVEGRRSHLSGDGYLKKGFPKSIRKWLEIIWSDGKRFDAGFDLKEICTHPEDEKFLKEYQYRSIQYRLRESREFELLNNEIQWLGKNKSLEKIGDIYNNPELIKTNQ